MFLFFSWYSYFPALRKNIDIYLVYLIGWISYFLLSCWLFSFIKKFCIIIMSSIVVRRLAQQIRRKWSFILLQLLSRAWSMFCGTVEGRYLCIVFKAETCLTLWELGYDIFVLRFQPKTNSCQLPFQHPCSSANCTRELFKVSSGSDSLLICTQKKIFWLGVADFLWVTS